MIKSTIFSVLVATVFTVTTNTTFAQTQKSSAPAKKVVPKPASATADIAQGQALMAKSDCFACHKTDVRLVGPSYLEIAKKYPATDVNYTLLSKKIIEGGAGVWGEIPMAPHPQISSADAKKMAKYILSLKSK